VISTEVITGVWAFQISRGLVTPAVQGGLTIGNYWLGNFELLLTRFSFWHSIREIIVGVRTLFLISASRTLHLRE
jgi:hypothetical protein